MKIILIILLLILPLLPLIETPKVVNIKHEVIINNEEKDIPILKNNLNFMEIKNEEQTPKIERVVEEQKKPLKVEGIKEFKKSVLEDGRFTDLIDKAEKYYIKNVKELKESRIIK